MKRQAIEHFAQIDLAKNPKMIGNRNLVTVTSFGRKFGFASSYLQTRGFFSDDTIVRSEQDDGPWPILTWPFLDFLASLDLSDTRLVELGAGASTLVLAQLFDRVESYENGAKFVERLRPRLPPNVTLTLFQGDTFDAGSLSLAPEDWLLVDFAGKRTRFIKDLVSGTPKGELPLVVILDNSDWYRTGAGLLAETGYAEIPFFGLKSGQTWVSCTSFFFVPERLQLKFRAPFPRLPFTRDLVAPWDSLD